MATHIFLLALGSVVALYLFMISCIATGLWQLFRKRQSVFPESPLSVSVILPVRNEVKHITHVLEELAGQCFSASQFEVIVSDDHSEDGTPEIVRDFTSLRHGFRLTLVEAASGDLPGKKAAIARALQHARGEILLFTDGDTFRGQAWVASMAASFGNPDIQLVAGPVAFINERNLLMNLQSQEFLGIMGTTAGSAALGLPLMCNGANLACRRSAFESVASTVGGTRFSSGDDQFLLGAIRRCFGGKSILFQLNPAAAVCTEPQPDFSGFINQRLRWAGKSRGYSDPVVIAAGLVTGLANLLLFTGLVAGIFLPRLLPAVALLWVAKVILEWPVTGTMGRFFGKPALSVYYLPAQLFQLLYVPFVAVMGMVLPFRWKGRRIRER